MGVLTPNKYASIPKQKAQKLPEYYNTHIAVGPPNFLENIVPILMSWTAPCQRTKFRASQADFRFILYFKCDAKALLQEHMYQKRFCVIQANATVCVLEQCQEHSFWLANSNSF